jgi:DNA invertase Pin-like site-specific DNA recombinase
MTVVFGYNVVQLCMWSERTVAIGSLSFMLHPMRKVKEPIAIRRAGKHTKGQRVGYMRVRSIDQNEGRQLEGEELDRTFLDKASGKDVRRPQLTAMLASLRKGDTVVCHSMDRLGRNFDDLRRLILGLTERGVRVQFVKENLTFTGEESTTANLLLRVMGAFAQFEHELIRERQREGIALAKAAGAYKGRKRSLSPDRAAELTRRLSTGESKSGLAREFGIDRATVYRYLGRAGKRSAPRRRKTGKA